MSSFKNWLKLGGGYSRNPIHRFFFKIYCSLSNAEIPSNVKIGSNVKFPHGVKGIVLHPLTIIEDNVTIFHQVTCGRGDLYRIVPHVKQSTFKGILLREGCVLCVGAKVLGKEGILTVGRNTIVAANAVLTQSTGDNEVWAGVPAKCIKKLVNDV